MTKFNSEGKETLTYGEALEPAMKITDQDDADQYLKDYVQFVQKCLDEEPNPEGRTAEEICRINLGYFSGYYDYNVQRRVQKLFLCDHPIFGKVKNEEE